MIRATKCFLASAISTIIVFAGFAGTAYAQGSRKDDIVFNAQGRPMAGATVRVCTSAAAGQPCAPLAQVYSDSTLTQALANPLSADGLGNYNFYAAPGRYTIELSGPGITTKQIPNVILPSDPSSPTFTSVTTTSGISAFSLSLTGNLTVNGSTAVAGSLTVGGLPVPTANQDNQWTAGQRFKGPIPYRDFTAYMPAGGCSTTIAQVDPPTTGSISSGSATLTLANARDFKNGCGIAVLGAGPTSTIGVPNTGCTISSIARSSNFVTVTCAASHNIPVYGVDHFQGIQITGVTDASFNGTFDIASATDTTHFVYAQNGANTSSSGGTATSQFGYAHGATGATTYVYQVAAVDGSGGISAASPAFSVTSANSTLTTENYNWINFGVPGGAGFPAASSIPHMWLIYSDKGLGGAKLCVGTSFTNAYADFGLAMPCPAFAPSTPPGAATAQMLNTTIVSGGGTTTLTLNTTASNTATAKNVYHDESSFLMSCVTDAVADQLVGGFGTVGSAGCVIPAGNYAMNGPMPTDTAATTSGIAIKVAGSLYLNTLPWFFSQSQYYVHGEGASGAYGQFEHGTSTYLHIAPSVPAVVVLRGTSHIDFSGFFMPSISGHGIWVGVVPYLGSPNSFRFDDNGIGEVDTSAGGGSPVVIDNDVIGVWMNNDFLASRHDGLPSMMITSTDWYSVTEGLIYITNLASQNRGIRIDGPGGNQSGGGINSIFINNWVHESLPATDKAIVVHDNGPNAPGAFQGGMPLNGISLHNVNNSDPVSGPTAYTIFEEIGTVQGISNIDVSAVGSFGGLLSCGPNTTVCNNPPSINGAVFNATPGGTWGGTLQVTPTVIHAELPILSKLAYGSYATPTTHPAWAMALPPPDSFMITGTGAGGLSATTYCMAVEGKDKQSTPGLTLPTNTILCQAVGAAASINVQWQQATGALNAAYAGFRFLFCTTGGTSCVPNTYIDLPSGGNPYNYTFTSTAGGTAQALNTTSTAYLSWFYWGAGSCLFCDSSGANNFYPIGIGEPNPGAGVKLAVAGGTIQGEAGIQAGADVAFNASPRGAYNAFLPNLTSATATYQRMTLDKAITVTRLQLVLGTAGAACTTQSTVSVTDGTSSVTLTTANGTAVYDTGAVSQNFSAAANLDIKIVTPASGCTTAPQNANVTAQYRMQ